MKARLLAAFLLVTGLAHADPASETRFFDERARKLYEKGKFADALIEFLHADAVTPSPRSLYNIAVCAELAGRPALAFAYYGAYLAGGDADGARRTDAEQRMQKLAGALALVRVTSDPPGATIHVDRAELGEWGRTPRTLPLEPGSRRITATLDGHQLAEATAVAQTGKTQEVVLKLVPRKGTLRVVTEPPSAKVELFRGSERIPALTSARTAELPMGRYRVRISAPGYAPSESTVVVREGQESRAVVSASALPKPVGRLLVGTGGVGAEIVVDGVAKGVAPARIDGVATGRHDVELRAKGYLPWRGTVEIREARTAFVDVVLRRAR